MRKVSYRCFFSKKEEDLLPDKIKKELKYLRNRLEEKDDEIHYLICCRLGDDPPRDLAEKFDKMYDF